MLLCALLSLAILVFTFRSLNDGRNTIHKKGIHPVSTKSHLFIFYFKFNFNPLPSDSITFYPTWFDDEPGSVFNPTFTLNDRLAGVINSIRKLKQSYIWRQTLYPNNL